MEDLIPNNPDIVGSGTNNLPVFCGWMPGKYITKGKKFVMAFNFADLDEEFKCKVFYEIAFKFGNINS